MSDKNSIFELIQVKKKLERFNLFSSKVIKKSFARNISIRSIDFSKKYTGTPINKGEGYMFYLVDKKILTNYCKKIYHVINKDQ